MDADRYTGPGGVKPGSMGLALGSVALIMVGLSFSAPHLLRPPETKLITRNIPLPAPKPEDKPVTKKQVATNPTPRREVIDSTPLPVPANPADTFTHTDTPFAPGVPDGAADGVAIEPIAKPLPIPAPVFLGARPDQRYAASFQPVYPPDERRAEHEGRVVVKVLIGVDGRVKQVERVSAASDSFFAATRDRALGKWRFKPATRDGVPVESWQTMSVSFVLHDE